MQTAFIILAIVAGMLMPVQAGINAKLADVINGAIPAAFVSFLVGTLVLGLVLAAMAQSVPVSRALPATPWWYWVGGSLGAFFVTATVILAPRIGAGAMIALTLAGQMGASMALDNYALLGFPHIPFDGKRLLGSVLLLAGVYLIRM
ncbi:DMT family transporter [Solidesulfovibrio sp. C21]|uniref:DMT family transporter n=1 Tax=Solidesulfovibrio sp. C21 TaxID=3398613 RepID=UPI0039FC0686